MKEKGWSTRGFARHLGMAPSQLHELLNGGRQTSHDVGRINVELGLATPEDPRIQRAIDALTRIYAISEDAALAQVEQLEQRADHYEELAAFQDRSRE